MAKPAGFSIAGRVVDCDAVGRHMPALLADILVLEDDVETMDSSGGELLYETDAFEHLGVRHFGCKGLPVPGTLGGLVGDARGRKTAFLWDARHCSFVS